MKPETAFEPTTAPRLAGRPKFRPDRSRKLREQIHEVMRFFHYAERTEESYWHWIERYLRFHRRPVAPRSSLGQKGNPHPALARHPLPSDGRGQSPAPTGEGTWRHPHEMETGEVAEFLSHLATERLVSASTHKQALRMVEG